MKNNEPVAYRHLHEDGWEYYDAPTGEDCNDCIPLYTHPAKTQSHTETAVKILNYLGYSQEPSREEGADARRDKLVEIISQSNPAKTLTDEEIKDIGYKFGEMGLNLEMIKTTLRKAQEK